MSSTIALLMIHCTATPKGRAVSSDDIEQWHIVENGWSRVGYSDMIHLDGAVENLIDWNQDDKMDPWEISNGARGYNRVARHVVYTGGVDVYNQLSEDTRTDEQCESLETYIKFMILRNPDIQVCGHCDVNKGKYCPSFDVQAFCREIGIPERNIYQTND